MKGVLVFANHVQLSAVWVLLVASLGLTVGELDHIWQETHCVVFVVDQRQDGELIVSKPECFLDEGAADARAAMGHESWSSSREVTDSGGSFASVLGKHYDGANGSGSSITITGSSCTGGYWNTGSAWANRISSSYNGCQHLRHWDLPSKGGASESTFGSGTTDNLGSMNNRTESVSYHSS